MYAFVLETFHALPLLTVQDAVHLVFSQSLYYLPAMASHRASVFDLELAGDRSPHRWV